MSPNRRSLVLRFATLGALVAAALAVLSFAARRASEARDPLADELARWSTFVTQHPAGDADWAQVRDGSAPALASARAAVGRGRRLMALSRLAAVYANLAGIRYAEALRARGPLDSAALALAWSRQATSLHAQLGTVAPAALDGVRPAAVRALAEASLSQVRGFHDASLDYGNSTSPEYGAFYLGAAQAMEDFVAFLRGLREPTPGPEPAFRSIAPELDSLGREMLAAYRPPLSIDHHAEFIVAHSALNEARALAAAGLHRGALLRYLQARVRFAPLRTPVAVLDSVALAHALAAADARLRADGRDHTLARMLLEIAHADAESAAPGATAATAAAIVTDVLPHYFAALEPAAPAPARPAPEVTVTLVRWPYT